MGLAPGPPAIGSVGPTTSPAALPSSLMDAAMATHLAREHVQTTAVAQSARADFYAALIGGIQGRPDLEVSPDRAVWAVTFSDTFAICPPNGGPCFSPRPGTVTVLLDYVSGEFITSSTFAPAP